MFAIKMDYDVKCTFFSEDISPFYSLCIIEFLYNEEFGSEGEELGNLIGADVYIPCDYIKPAKVPLPSHFGEKRLLVTSTNDFRSAICQIENLLPKFVAKENISGCREILKNYCRAIDISEREKQPIFISY